MPPAGQVEANFILQQASSWINTLSRLNESILSSVYNCVIWFYRVQMNWVTHRNILYLIERFTYFLSVLLLREEQVVFLLSFSIWEQPSSTIILVAHICTLSRRSTRWNDFTWIIKLFSHSSVLLDDKYWILLKNNMNHLNW